MSSKRAIRAAVGVAALTCAIGVARWSSAPEHEPPTPEGIASSGPVGRSPDGLAAPTRAARARVRSATGAASDAESGAPETGSLVVVVETRVGDATSGRAWRPVAGADVVVTVAERTWEVEAGADGSARFEALPIGQVAMHARAEGFVGSENRYLTVRKGALESDHVRLDRGVPFDGRVVDHLAHPVVGASVTIAPAHGDREDAEAHGRETPFDEATTDRDGSFHVGGIPVTGKATAVAVAPGFASTSLPLETKEGRIDPSPVVLRLEPEGRLVGVVRDPSGTPVAGATVYVFPATDSLVREDPTIDWTSACDFIASERAPGVARRGVCAANGAFEVEGLRPGAEHIAVAYAHGFTRSREVGGIVSTATVRDVHADISLRPTSQVDVHVVDLAGHPVLAKLSLTLDDKWFDGEWNRPPEQVGNRHRFEGVLPGPHRVAIVSAEYLDAEASFKVVGAGTTDVRVALDPGASASGLVVDGAGVPVEGADVCVGPVKKNNHDDADKYIWGGRWAKTDAEGRFAFAGLTPGESVIGAELVPDEDTSVRRTIRRAHVTLPGSEIRLVLARLGSVRLRLLTPAGAPFVGRVDLRGVRSRTWAEGKPLVDGRARFLDLLPGPTRLSFVADGYAAVDRSVDIPVGDDVDLGDVHLETGASWSVRVVDGAGVPVQDAEVELDDRAATCSKAGVGGRVTVEHLLRRRTHVVVSARGFVDTHAEIEFGSGKEPVELALRRGARVFGAVAGAAGRATNPELWFVPLDPSGHPIAGAAWERAEVRYAGTYETRLEAGEWRVIRYMAEGEPPVVVGRLTLVEGETREWSLGEPTK